MKPKDEYDEAVERINGRLVDHNGKILSVDEIVRDLLSDEDKGKRKFAQG